MPCYCTITSTTYGLHATFYATVCCSGQQDSLRGFLYTFKKALVLLHVLYSSYWCKFSLMMTHRKSKHVSDICFILNLNLHWLYSPLGWPYWNSTLWQYLYSRTPLIRINWDAELSGCAENPDNWVFNSKLQPTRCNFSWIYLFSQPLYMFQAVPPPIIRSTQLYIQLQVLSTS